MFVTGDLGHKLPPLEVDEVERRRRVAAVDTAIGEAGSHINAAMARLIDDIASFDELEGWGDHGAKTLAEWVAWRLGVTPADARHHVRVARKLRELPQIAAAFGRGELSYWQVRVMVPCATPEVEAEFLNMARYTTAGQLQRVMRAYKGFLDRAEAELAEARHTQRCLHYYFDDDGFLRITGKLSPEEGQILVAALEAAEQTLRDELDQETVKDTTVEQLCADALTEVARAALHGTRRGTQRPVVIPKVAVHVDVMSLLNGTGERCEVTDGPTLASETARRLTCDCALESYFEGDGELKDLGRRKRVVSPRMRKALEKRDACCVFPGCDRKRFLEAHHVVHWVYLGETKLENLALLCWHHHRLVHEGGFKIQINEDMSLSFFNPEGHLIPRSPALGHGDMTRIVEDNEHAGLDIDKETCQTQWDGAGIDLAYCVDALLSVTGKLAVPIRGQPAAARP
ncbi:MAG TPA: DUF222 domain-containing protein [Actinomycetota bacterium]|nr:DUF222 domain-containing protein [Actinomycetota bacterium]